MMKCHIDPTYYKMGPINLKALRFRRNPNLYIQAHRLILGPEFTNLLGGIVC